MPNEMMPNVVPSEIKFTEEEVKEVNEIKSGFDKATLTFGQFYIQKMELLKLEENLKKEYDLLQKQEKDFFDRIIKKYGEGTYNPITNTFTKNK